MLPEDIYTLIKAKRKQLNLTQEQLAEKAGLSTTFISNVESGKRNMSVATFNKIAQSLDIDLYDILPCDEAKERHKHSMIKDIVDNISGLPHENVKFMYKVFLSLRSQND